MKKEAGDSCEWDGKTRRLIARRREMKTNTRQCHRLARGGVGWGGGGGVERGRGGGGMFHYVILQGKAGRRISGCLAKSRPFNATWGVGFDCFPLPLQLPHAGA